MAVLELDRPDVRQLGCTEIWCDNEAADNGVAIPGIDAWVYSRPYGGDESGGDIHYMGLCGAGAHSRFAVADVAGHGSAVSNCATHLKRMLRENMNEPNVSVFARDLNDVLVEATASSGKFVTALVASYIAPLKQMAVCNAGHPRPLWYRAEEDAWHLIREDCPHCRSKMMNLPLGIIEGTEYFQMAVELGDGDVVVMYTDSLIETTGENGRHLGEEGLLEIAATLDVGAPDEFSHRLVEAVRGFGGVEESDDDVTIMTLFHHGVEGGVGDVM